MRGEGANIQAYYDTATIKGIKSFTVQGWMTVTNDLA